MIYPQLHFTGQVWRPPYEAGSQLLQITSGCTWHLSVVLTLIAYDMNETSKIIADISEIVFLSLKN